MKIDLNLSLLPRPRERYALTWSVPVALVGLVGLVILSALSVKALRDYRDVRQTLQEVQERELQLRDREAEFRRELAKPQYQRLSRDTQFVNALIGKKYLALTELTARITRTLPPTVKLTSLALARPVPDPLLRITVSGQTAEAVEGFLGQIENADDFADVAIMNQTFEDQQFEGGRVTVTCTARYLGAKVPSTP